MYHGRTQAVPIGHFWGTVELSQAHARATQYRANRRGATVSPNFKVYLFDVPEGVEISQIWSDSEKTWVKVELYPTAVAASFEGVS